MLKTIKRPFMLLCLYVAGALVSGCHSGQSGRSVRSERPFHVRSYHAVVWDDGEESHQNVKVDTAELDTGIDHGAAIDWAFSSSGSVELSFLNGRHTLEDTADVDIGDVTVNPVFLTAKGYFRSYHPSAVHPYVGLGISYARFTGESLQSGSSLTGFDVEDGVGFVMQTGTEISLYPRTNRFFLSFDIKWNLMRTDVEIQDASETADERMNMIPFIAGGTLGIRF